MTALAISLLAPGEPGLFAEQTARKRPIRFTLDYTTVYSGLRTILPVEQKGMPKIGIALAGGGARAAASVGVLKVLHREGVTPSVITGTSMGALIGGLYAAGYSPDEIEQILISNDWNDMFRDSPGRAFQTQEQKQSAGRHLLEFNIRGGRFTPPTGLSAGQKLANLLQIKTLAASFEARQDFDRLPIPFRAIATNLETGEPEAIGKGLLQDAMRASAAIPFIFQPVEIHNRLYVDGGMTKNLPVDVARDMGAEIVIAIDPSARPFKRDRLKTLFDVMDQSVTLNTQKETLRQAAMADIVISPDTSAYSFADFPQIKEIILIGEKAAEAAVRKIKEMVGRKAGKTDKERYMIEDIVIAGNKVVPEEFIRRIIDASITGREVSAGEIERGLAELFRLGFFWDISLELEGPVNRHTGILRVTENPVLTGIEITGNDLIPSSDILTEIGQQTGRPLNAARLIEGLGRLVEKWRRKGYPLVHVDRAEIKDGLLHISLFEGRVEAIGIRGQKKTRLSLIRREIETAIGQPLNINTLSADIQRLYALGYFESLNVGLSESRDNGVLLTINIKEKPKGTVRLGMRFDLEDSFTGLTDIVIDNITGRGIKLYLNTRYGNYTDIALGYHSPVFLRSPLVHSIEGFYNRRNYFIYEDEEKTAEAEVARIGLHVSLGLQWLRFGDTYIRYRYESDRTTTVFGGLPKEDRHIGSWAVLSTIDTLDSHPFAHKGFLFKGSYETAAEGYGSDINYRKTELMGQANIPLAARHTAVIEAAGGLGSGAIPFFEKFGLGGVDYLISYPLLGYKRREFLGSNMLAFTAAYRWKAAEYQLKFLRAVYLQLTAQAANVWNARDEMSAKDLKKGGGIGVHADTLIGPVRLDLGLAESGRFQVYFSVGFDF